MDDLTLVGVHEDGEHVLLVDGEGRRHRLRVDEALRAAVRRDRARLGQLQIEMDGGLRPREIQARIRAGESAEEVSAAAGVPLEHVRRYEGPVLAEREFVASQARDVRLRRGVAAATGEETLGAVVSERLQQREVEPEDVVWDAWRADDGTWTIVLTFTAGSKDREARWSYDPPRRHVAPLDDEARWLTDDEPEQPQVPTAGHRRLAPVRDRVYDVEATGTARPVREEQEEPPAAELLDTLRERRGRRSRLATGDAEASAVDPVREAIDSLMSRGELRASRPDPAREAARDEAREQARDEPRPPEQRPEPARNGRRRPAENRRGKAGPPEEELSEPPAAHPARSRPQEARDGEVLVLPDAPAEAKPEPVIASGGPKGRANGTPGGSPGGSSPAGEGGKQPTARKQRRASVPSWDDIVFGQRRD